MTTLEKSLLLIEINALKISVDKAQKAVYPKVQTWGINTAFESIFLNIAVLKTEIGKQEEK